MTVLAEKWVDESSRHPEMEKDTFVRNQLFGSNAFADLIVFLKDDPDLHDRVFENTTICSPAIVTTPDPDRSGWNICRTDLSKPHVVLRVQIEVATDGRGKILADPAGLHSHAWDHE